MPRLDGAETSADSRAFTDWAAVVVALVLVALVRSGLLGAVPW